jgi:hypothetical protein
MKILGNYKETGISIEEKMNVEIKTQTGGTWHTKRPAYSNLITHIDDRGYKVRSTLTIIGIVGTHDEFMELKTDLLVSDQFGDCHEICEDFVWQN